MAKILCSPSKYVQGAGEMKKLGSEVWQEGTCTDHGIRIQTYRGRCKYWI